jgi:hypothetical protein
MNYFRPNGSILIGFKTRGQKYEKDYPVNLFILFTSFEGRQKREGTSHPPSDGESCEGEKKGQEAVSRFGLFFLFEDLCSPPNGDASSTSVAEVSLFCETNFVNFIQSTF